MGHTYRTSNYNDYIAIYKKDIEIDDDNDEAIVFINIEDVLILKKENERLKEILKVYADKNNWGYYDESGCPKGKGKYTDACFIGPEPAIEGVK